MANWSEKIDELPEEHSKNALWSLFKDVLHVNDKLRSRYFELLFESVAPKGNIYKRNAFYLEHRLHSLDLWEQMHEIAEKHQSLLQKGSDKSIEECADVLLTLLENVIVDIPEDEEKGTKAEDDMQGYPPIEEFLNDRVRPWGPFVMYEDPEKRAEEIKHRLIAANVFALQFIAPFLICFNRWNMDTNYFKKLFNKDYVTNKLTVAELACFGTTFTDVCTTLLGMQLLIAVIFITRCYVDDQVNDIRKWQRLPHSSGWLFVDVFVNTWCVIFILFGIPLLFWSEDTPTNIVLDSMTLLFLFKLDDLSDVMCSYIGMDHEDFQRTVACMVAFLSKCPVDLEKVINPDAQSQGELWSIRLDQNGNLIGSDGNVVETRLQFKTLEETSWEETQDENRLRSSRRPYSRKFTRYGATTQTPQSEAFDTKANELIIQQKARFIVHRNRKDRMVLPSMYTKTLTTWWVCLSYFVRINNWLMPILWYLINKPCYPGVPHKPSK